jgi:hypothetical protein
MGGPDKPGHDDEKEARNINSLPLANLANLAFES